MAERFPGLSESHVAFIRRQHIFFTATATAESRVNISPRSTEALRVIGPNRVAYLDLTGSGNETAAHLKADGRMTIMFCAVAGPPMIMRLYGRGTNHYAGTEPYETLIDAHFEGRRGHAQRQVVVLDVDLVSTSCGYGVPLFAFEGERPSIVNWAKAKTPEQVRDYWRTYNRESLDGLPTGIPVDD